MHHSICELNDNQETECPTQINFNNCRHVFGNLRLRKLIYGNAPWSNRCPLCRAHWFHTIFDDEGAAFAQTMLEVANSESREPFAVNSTYHNAFSVSIDLQEYTHAASPLTREESIADQAGPDMESTFEAEVHEAWRYLWGLEIPLNDSRQRETDREPFWMHQDEAVSLTQEEHDTSPQPQRRLF
jgi:hypothetical protein